MSFLSLKSFKKKEKFLFSFLIVFVVFLVVSKGNLVKAIHLPEANIVVEGCDDMLEKLQRVPGPPHHPPFFNPPFIDRVSYCTERIADYNFQPRWQGLRLIRAIAEIDHSLSHYDFERIIRYYGWWGEYSSRIFNALHDEWSFADMGAICRDSGEGADPWGQLEVRCLSRAGQAKLWLNFLKLPQPDLVPDLSQIQVKVGGNIERLPVGLDTRYRPIEISNIKVKNMGDGPAGESTTVIYPFGIFNSRFFTFSVPRLGPGQSYTLPPLRIDSNLLRELDEKNLFSLPFSEDYSLVVFVDATKTISESNEENNRGERTVFSFSSISVKVKDENGKKIFYASVKVENLRGDGPFPVRKKRTDKRGEASFALLEQPGQDLKYKVTVSKFGVSKSFEINVTEYRDYHKEIELDLPDGLLFVPKPLLHDDDNFLEESSSNIGEGYVIVRTDTGQDIRKEANQDGAFLILLDELPQGTQELILKEMKVKIDFTMYNLRDSVTYHWLEGQQQVREIRAKPKEGELEEIPVEIRLKRDCTTRYYGRGGETVFCIYDEEEEIEIAKNGYLQTVIREISRLKSFIPWGLRELEQPVIITFFHPDIGAFDPNISRIELMGRYLKVNQFIARLVTLHEALHALDRQWGRELFGGDDPFTRQWEPYYRSFLITAVGTEDNFLTRQTGLWAWRYLGHTCSHVSNPEDRRFCLGHYLPDSPIEVFAEQISAICLGLPVAQRFANAEAEWQRLNPGQPVPPDLLRHRDVIASRSVGNQVSGDPGNVIYRYQDSNPITAFSPRLSWLVQVCSFSGIIIW